MTGLELEDFADNRRETRQDEIMMPAAGPGRLQNHGGATDGARGLGVLPFVTDDEGVFQFDVPLEGGFHEQAGLRLAAGAAVGGVMRADKDVVEREHLPER